MNMKSCLPTAVVVFLAGTAFGDAPTNAGGTYSYTSAYGDNQTTGQTGDQIWVVENAINVSTFYPGAEDDTPYWQIYTGKSITATGNTRVMRGNVAFENDVYWNGVDNHIGLLGDAKLVLRNGGTLTITKEPLRIGQYYSAEFPNATGILYMEEPSRLDAIHKNVIAGNNRPGALWMSGGTLQLTNAILKTGSAPNTEGYIRMTGGTILLASGAVNKLQVAANDGYGSLHISGGTLQGRGDGTGEVYLQIAANTYSSAADIYLDGGVLDGSRERIAVGVWSASTTGKRAALTVDGDAQVSAYVIVLGRNGQNNLSALNLNGGRFSLSRIFGGYDGRANARFLNFDGGILNLRYNAQTWSSGSLDSNCGQALVYPGGATIEVNGSDVAVMSVPFRAAEGYGVETITLSSPGQGYITAPKVTLSGGSGSNATAYAVLKKDCTLEKIVVTCRGEGYAANDTIAVTITSSTGSGAAATATLAPNAGGILRKTGSGTWEQAGTDNTFAGAVEIAEGTLILNDYGFPSASALRMGNTILRVVNGTTASLARLDAANGVVQLRTENRDTSNTTSLLDVGTLALDGALALVTHTNNWTMKLAATDLTATSSAESPVVNGLVYANLDAENYRAPRLFERAADGTLTVAPYAETPGPNANWRPTGHGITNDAFAAVNSITLGLTPTCDQYVRSNERIEIKSGMIVMQRPHADAQRISILGDGAFTTRAKGGMFIYADNREMSKRSNNSGNSDIYVNTTRRLLGPFADPDDETPMALTVAGLKEERPEQGAQAWLLDTQTFSGGLNLVNGGVFIASDNGLGAAGSPVRASGYCSISAYKSAFDIAHPLILREGSALIFSPSSQTGNTVSSALSGTGDLLTGDIQRAGYVTAFTGDHTAFSGTYYIQGHARIAPAVFSANAGICLADSTNGVGVIEAAGTFARPLGTGKGALCWKRFAAYSSDYGLRGGFAAVGGDLTVSLGAPGTKLAPGADYLPAGTVIQLQSQYANGVLTFANGFELNGKTQKIQIQSGKTATLTGAVSDAIGGGTLAVTGNLVFAGTLEGAEANVDAAPLLTVTGDLTFADGAQAALADTVTPESLPPNGLLLATATGTMSGTPALAAPALDGRYRLRVKDGALTLVKKEGFTVTIR